MLVQRLQQEWQQSRLIEVVVGIVVTVEDQKEYANPDSPVLWIVGHTVQEWQEYLINPVVGYIGYCRP